MELKINWLSSRRQQLLREWQQVQGQCQQLLSQQISRNAKQQEQLQRLREEIGRGELARKQERATEAIRLRSLEELAGRKERGMQELKIRLGEMEDQLGAKQASIEQLTARVLHLEHKLQVSDQQLIRDGIQYEAKIKAQQLSQQQKLGQLTTHYERRLRELEEDTKRAHEVEMMALRQNSLKALQKLQSELHLQTGKFGESGKQLQSQNTRLVTQNSRLLMAVNDYKMRILNLEGESLNLQQQAKISQKQLQMIRQAAKKEGDFLREERQELMEKNKRLLAKVDELVWTVREVELKKEEDVKRIRGEVDKSFQQILDKAQAERKELIQQNEGLQRDLKKQKNREQQWEQRQKTLLTTIETLANEKQELIKEFETLKRGGQDRGSQGLIKVNGDLKKEIIRKNCQIEVLHEQVKRLKTKVNKIAGIQQEALRQKQVMQKQNKMLLSQIIFLRQKEKKSKGKMGERSSRILSQVQSEESRDEEDVETYKMIIKQLDEGMNQALGKIRDKDVTIQKQRVMIEKMERLLNSH